MAELFFLALSWFAWCALHSLLINEKIQSIARQVLGRFGRAYRLLYIVISILTLLPVLWYQETLPRRLLLPATLPLHLAQGGLLLYAALMFYLGARAYDLAAFLGIRQWRQGSETGTEAGPILRTDGILACVRHPWYSGGIALIWGIGPITEIFVLTRILLTLYLVLGTFLEEQRLLAKLGDQYRAYRRSVPMLFPSCFPCRRWKKGC